MELNSLINIKIASDTAKKGSDEILDGLHKIDAAVIKTTGAADSMGKQFDKANNSISNTSTNTAKRITDSNNNIAQSATRVGVAYSNGVQSVKTFGSAVEESNKNVANFPNGIVERVIAYSAAYAGLRAVMSGATGVLQLNRDFETGMIGVAKTTNLAGKDLEDFKNKMIQVSKDIPVSTDELLELSQAAGQMGVRGSENLEKFAVTMAKVGRSTNIAGAEAARGLARILAVSGEGSEGLETLANSIVRMGNNSKATEAEILGMTTRISQSLAVFGVASSQSVALAAAMKSVGVTAELGGSAVGRSMQTITNAVLGSTNGLNKFAKELNLDPAKLKELFNTDKIKSFNYFLEGIASKGLGAGLALDKVGLGGTEIITALGPLASNMNILRDAQDQVNKEVENGTALNNEFNATLKTFDSQIIIAGNNAKSYALKISEVPFQKITEGLTAINNASKNGGFDVLIDGASIASLVITARLVPSIGTYIAATAQRIQIMAAERAAHAQNATVEAATATRNLAASESKLAQAVIATESTKKQVIAERSLQIARIEGLRSVLLDVQAEKTLQISRIQSQIGASTGALAVRRLAAARLEEVAITNQLAAAEIRLAATTVDGNAASVAAMRARAAAELQVASASAIATEATTVAAIQNKALGVSATVATFAQRGLATSMAFLGGPAGVILIAAGSLAYFATKSTDAEKRLNDLRAAADAAAPSISNIGNAAKNLEISKLNKDIEESTKQLNEFKGLLSNAEKFKMNLNSDALLVVHRDAELVNTDLERMKLRLFELKDPNAFKKMQDEAKELGEAFNVIVNKVEPVVDSVADLSKETESLLKNLTKQRDLFNVAYNDNALAVEFLYDLERGLVDVSNEKTKQTILLRYKNIDALNAERTAFDASLAAEGKMIENNIEKIKEQLAARKAASEAEYKIANENLKAQEKSLEESFANSARAWEESAKRIDGTFADMWAGSFKSFKSFRNQMVDGVKKLAGEIIHQATTKKLTDALLNFSGGNSPANKAWQMMPATLDNAFQSAPSNAGSGGTGSGGASGLMGIAGAAGPYAIAAVAVVAAVGIWNKKQDEKFVKLGSEYKQANQGMSKVLGEGIKKSETINNSIQKLAQTGGEALGVNYNMLQALLDIRAGIGNVAAGFAKTLIGGADYNTLGITQGASTNKYLNLGGYGSNQIANATTKLGVNSQDKEFQGAVENFMNSITGKVNKAIYNSRSKVIDSGIAVFGGSLVDIINGATIEAANYADLKKTKKVFGVNIGQSVDRKTEDLDALFIKQFSSVFENAGKALKISSNTFGVDFNQYVNQLTIKKQDLSLKGLKGDELSKAIESFFGSQIDEWANILLGGTQVLKDFQQIGESSFDTMIRLSSETEVFKSSATTLGLNFRATGLEAVYATQAMQEVAGGFDNLSSKLSNYYSKFFTNEEKSAAQKLQIDAQFKDLGMTMPATRREFRDLVSSMDLLTDSGREGSNKLLDLVPLMDSYYTSIGDLQENAARNNLNSADQLFQFSKKTLAVADSLLLSDLSVLKPSEKLEESKNQFYSARGDDVGSAAQEYLQQAREMFASSAEYTKIFKEVQDRLRGENSANLIGVQQPQTASNTAQASAAIAAQANGNAQGETANVKDTNPLDAVVVSLKSANDSLNEQLKVQVTSLNEFRIQSKAVADQSGQAVGAIASLTRKVDELVEVNSRNSRVR